MNSLHLPAYSAQPEWPANGASDSSQAQANAAPQTDFTALMDTRPDGLPPRPSRVLQEALEPVQHAMGTLEELPELPANATTEEVMRHSLEFQRAMSGVSIAMNTMNLLATATTKTLNSIVSKQ